MPTHSSTDSEGGLPGWAKAIALLAVGIAVSGLADFALAQAGYGSLGTYVWAIGYAGTILLLFFLFLRPLDLTGPDGDGS